MMKRAKPTLLLLGYLALIFVQSRGAFVGIGFGTAVTNLPRPERAVDLLRSMGVGHVRLYDDADPSLLTAFAGSGIQVLVGVPNNAIQGLALSSAAAGDWVRTRVAAFLPNTNITGIVVGDAVFSSAVSTSCPAAAPLLLPALRRLHAALARQGLSSKVFITAAISSEAVLGGFPPSRAFFNSSTTAAPLLDFLGSARSPLLLSVDAAAIYRDSSSVTSLDYALCQPNPGVLDVSTGLNYTCLVDAVLDATATAMARLNHTTDETPLLVATGWPWRDDSGAEAASVQNAQSYNTNLVRRVVEKKGTPMRPGADVPAYIYELYSEDKKTSQRWGLFSVNQTAVYRVDVSGVSILRDEQPQRRWCVAKAGAPDAALSTALNWACGPGGADCGPVQPGGACYMPNQVASHASFAFNSYYQRNVQGNGTCDFSGCAQLTNVDPSYDSCIYPSASLALDSTVSSNSTTDVMGTRNSGGCSSIHGNPLVLVVLAALCWMSLQNALN